MSHHAVTLGLVLGACLSSLPATVLAQQSDRTSRLDPASARAIEEILREAGTLGIPTEPLQNKVHEGVSKGADGARIVEVVQRFFGRLRRGAAALGSGSTTAELVAGASVLDLGVPDSALMSLRVANRDGELASALVGLAFLVQRGIPVERSVRLVQDLVAVRITPSDFARFRRLVDDDIRAGAPAAGAAEARARAWVRHGGAVQGVPPAESPS